MKEFFKVTGMLTIAGLCAIAVISKYGHLLYGWVDNLKGITL